MKTANYDRKTRELKGWYDKEIHTKIPTPNIEVTNEIWEKALNEGANFVDVENKTLSVKDFRSKEELKEAEVAKLKAKKTQALKELTVTTKNKNTFDANEPACVAIQGAIIASDISGIKEHDWKLANNSWTDITIDELREVLVLAMVAKGKIMSGKDVK